MPKTRQIHLARRPRGAPSKEDFTLVAVELPEPQPGEVQVRNTWMSVDPYMRGRMDDGPSYAAPWQIGGPADGMALGEVTASDADGFEVGDLVLSNLGWREAFTAPAAAVERLDSNGMPPEAFLGIAGIPGLTAWAGLLQVADLQNGDVVFVSGAAGAVGSVVCQIAKAKGHTVIGSAGGAAKTAFLKDIGVDHVIDYKTDKRINSALRAVAPDGIDVYFDNVGGSHLEAAIGNAREFARFAICGMITVYNNTEPTPAPRNLALVMGKSIRMQGFLVSTYYDRKPELIAEIARLYAEGKMSMRNTVYEGLENAPRAFLGLFTGDNVGKMLVKLA